ncbi:MAG: hypothetical protein IT385_14800 [Deltaproteobacteria bacterium]|nr:hypothetical protein [Deltaproteobacteria bacterium]
MPRLVLALLMLAPACSEERDDVLWSPATVEHDPTCATGCVEVGRVPAGHHATQDFVFRVNPDVDDAVAQYGDCVESVLACLEAGTDLRTCAARGDCPTSCKRDFAARARGLTDLVEIRTAFEAVFILRDAPCRPVDPHAPPPPDGGAP